MGAAKPCSVVANIIVFLCSIAVLGAGIYLKTRNGSSACLATISDPILIIGIIMTIIAICGVIGALFDVTVLMFIYLAVTFLAMVALLIITILTFIVTSPSVHHTVGDKGIGQYRLDDFSSWLQHQVNDTSHWKTISSCIASSGACAKLYSAFDKNGTTQVLQQLNTSTDVQYLKGSSVLSALSPIELGCCIPPVECEYSFSPTNNTWLPSSTTALSNDTDCTTFSNNSTAYCYQCNQCKAGVLEVVRKDWEVISIVNIVALAFIFIVYTVGCCAYRSARREKRAMTYQKF